MNAAQLLDPKGFAKAKSRKRAPNYGPQQTRKQLTTTTEPKVTIPTYDPKALLNPKAAAKPSTMDSKSEEEVGNEQDSNFATFYERHHNVKNREAPVTVKRRSQALDDDGDDDTKRQQTTFSASKGGIISDHLKKEREALAKVNGVIQRSVPIDLTAEDDDVAIIGELTKEVCLGMLNAKAQCSMVPAVNKAGKSVKTIWPLTKLGMTRRPGNDMVVELTDARRDTFGRLELSVASAMVPLMDGSSHSHMRVKTFLKARPVKGDEKVGDWISESYHIMLIIYAPRDKADSIGKYLSQKQQWLNPPPDTGNSKIPYYNPQAKNQDHRPTHIVNGVKKPVSSKDTIYGGRTEEERQQALDKIFDTFVKHEDLPQMEADETIIKTKLLAHQKQALRFMIDHEDSENTEIRSRLWELKQFRGQEQWHNFITDQIETKKPEPTMGGILADMMGLGKTLSMLALTASTKSQAKDFTRSELPKQLQPEGMVVKATLLICPTSVLTNWQDQHKTHINANQLKLYVYHGSNRTQSLDELSKYHIILTSYGTLASEFEAKRNSKNALFRIKWFRIILDEAHQIRNQTTIAYKAACALHAQRRWAVTGTPVQNKLEDLAALVAFLRVEPFNNPVTWAQHITSPFKVGNDKVIKHLRIIVDSITLRRMKDTIDLPARREYIVRLKFSDEEQKLYDAFSLQSNMKLQTLTRGANVIRGKGYSHILKAILRMRMICCHGQELVPEDDMKEIQGYDSNHPLECGDYIDEENPTFIRDKEAYETFEMQQSGEVNQCIVCNQPVNQPDEEDAEVSEEEDVDRYSTDATPFAYLTTCYHLLHAKCKEQYVESITPILKRDQYYYCPIDNDYVRNEYFPLTDKGFTDYQQQKERRAHLRKQANFNPETFKPSTKVQELIRQLRLSEEETRRLPKGEPPIRSVVFSEWTSYLDLIGIGLDLAGITYVRLDGSMSISARAKVLQKFQTNSDACVLVVSIKAGGQGLNYVAANKVYLMEPQFNPGVEQQAVDRVHRLGQKRDVEITHFIMSGTTEDGILALQEKKIKLANLSLERKRTGPGDAKKRMEELKALFK